MAMRTHKNCPACGERLPVENFRLKTPSRGGPKQPCYICRKCERLRANERNARKAATGSVSVEVERDEFEPLQPWPWAPGERVFEDMPLRRAA